MAIAQGVNEWRQIPASLRHVKKLGDIKFYQCPLSCITQASWELLQLVQETTNSDGAVICLPEAGGLNDQPPRWRQGVQIMKVERALHQKRQMEKR